MTSTCAVRTATLVRDAVPADLPAVRAVLRAAYLPYARSLPPPVFRAYLSDVLDVHRHAAAGGQVIVAELAGRILATAVFYPDAAVLGFGLPAGWASGRTLGVHPAGRGHGLARALLAEFEARARRAGAPVFAFHTASFMAAAVRLYESLGYRRAPELDIDMGARYGVASTEPIVAIGYRRDLVDPRCATRGAGMSAFARIFAVTSAAWFLFALDRMVVTTALPAIRTELGAAVEDLEWTVNAYTLTFAVLLLTGAALGDRFGRRRMLAVGVGVFTVGSAAAALAPSVQALVAARALQGVGAALYMPLTLTVLAAAAPPGRRGAALGAWGSLGALGGALGPPLGGALTAGPGWQWIFWLNVPLGMVLVPLALRHLPESHGPQTRLDLPGVGLGSTALVGIVWGLVGGNAAGWTSARTLLALGAGVLALVAFLAWERVAPAPMLPLRLFGHRAFAAANLSSMLMYAAMFGAVFLVAQLLQTGLGAGPLQGGLRTLPMVGAPLLLSPVAGTPCDRVGARPLMVLAAGVEAAALAWLALVARPGVDYGLLVPALVLMGAGAALFFAPIATVTLGAVTPAEHGIASGTTTAVRELAVVLGVAVLGSVFARYGGVGSPEQFAAGCAPALGVAAALAAAAGLAALALPRTDGFGLTADAQLAQHNRPDPLVTLGSVR